jgi:hypothetical protein
MNNMVSKIDELIKYLTRVFNGTELTSESKKEQEKYGDYTKEDEIVRSQDFFILTKDLDNVLKEWFVGYKNDEELNKTLKFKLGALKKLSFPKGKEVFFLYKDKTNHNNVFFTKQRHDDYSHIIHSHLIEVFEEKLKELNAEVISDNPYPLLFVSRKVYDDFITYTSMHIIEYYLDYSYLKKRLDNENLIHRTMDNDFMKIIYSKMELISERDYKDYQITSKLYSLNKSSSVARENNFNNIFLD